MPHTVLLLALEPSLPAQMVQVGDALAHGKPLLGQGKVVPAPGADVPGHVGGGFIGGAAGAGAEDGGQLVQAAGVVLQQGIHPGGQRTGAAVAGQSQAGGSSRTARKLSR